MTSDRPYRKRLPHETAVEEITNHRGKQFDPKVVDAFLACADRFREAADADEEDAD